MVSSCMKVDILKLNYVIFTCSLQTAIIIKALGIVGQRVYGFSLSLNFWLNFYLQVVPNVVPLFYLNNEHTCKKKKKYFN